MMLHGINWTIDAAEMAALNPSLRTTLAQRYGWVNVPAHTHAAIVNVRESTPDGTFRHLAVFVFSCDAAAYNGNTAGLKDAIASEVRTRVNALWNAQPLTALAGRCHWVT